MLLSKSDKDCLVFLHLLGIIDMLNEKSACCGVFDYGNRKKSEIENFIFAKNSVKEDR